MTTKTIPREKENYYSLKEAMEIIGVKYDAIAGATRVGVFTTTRSKGCGQSLYIPKAEVEVLRGLGEVSSVEARAKVKVVRDARDYVEEEHTYGDPIRAALRKELPAAFESDDVMEKLAHHLAPLLRETFREVLRGV